MFVCILVLEDGLLLLVLRPQGLLGDVADFMVGIRVVEDALVVAVLDFFSLVLPSLQELWMWLLEEAAHDQL